MLTLVKDKFILFCFFVFSGLCSQSQNMIKGFVTESDSLTPMPFVYVINSQTGHGQMSDGNGHFSILANDGDSIIFSFVGYMRLKLPAYKLCKGGYKECKVVMQETVYKLNQVIVSDFKLKPYEKDYMRRVIQGSKIKPMNVIESPLSALYVQFSQKGKEQRKLAQIFEEIFIKEEVSKKFNPEILRKLTGDDQIDFEKFRKYCFYLSNDFIIQHDGYELYAQVMDCYYRWKQEGR